MLHRHYPPALSTMGGECWLIWQLHCSQGATLLLSLSSWPHHHLKRVCTVKLIQITWGLLLTCGGRQRSNQSRWQALGSHLTAARGLSRPGYSSKCLNMKLIGYSLLSQRSRSLASQSLIRGETTPLWLSFQFNIYLSLWVRLLISVISRTTLSHCLAVNFPSLDTLTSTLLFRTDFMKLRRWAGFTQSFCRGFLQARVLIAGPGEGEEDLQSILNDKVKLQLPVTCI